MTHAALWTARQDKNGHRLWHLHLMNHAHTFVADVTYLGERRWQGQCFWGGKRHWVIVGSTKRARQCIESWLDRKHWDAPRLINPA